MPSESIHMRCRCMRHDNRWKLPILLHTRVSIIFSNAIVEVQYRNTLVLLKT